MNVSRINQRNIELDRTERANIQYKREEDYRKVVEKRNADLDCEIVCKKEWNNKDCDEKESIVIESKSERERDDD